MNKSANLYIVIFNVIEISSKSNSAYSKVGNEEYIKEVNII